MKNYEVTLTATSCKTVTLSAESEKAAKKLAGDLPSDKYQLLIILFHLPIYRRLSSKQDFLDVVELIQCLYWGEVVDIQTQDLITNLAQYWVVQLEETQLHTLFMFVQMLHVRFKVPPVLPAEPYP